MSDRTALAGRPGPRWALLREDAGGKQQRQTGPEPVLSASLEKDECSAFHLASKLQSFKNKSIGTSNGKARNV